MSFERSYSIESHERIKQIFIFGDKSLLLIWWVTYVLGPRDLWLHKCSCTACQHPEGAMY